MASVDLVVAFEGAFDGGINGDPRGHSSDATRALDCPQSTQRGEARVRAPQAQPYKTRFGLSATTRDLLSVNSCGHLVFRIGRKEITNFHLDVSLIGDTQACRIKGFPPQTPRINCRI